MKFDFNKIFSLNYMRKLCLVQNFILLLWYKDTFIDSYCLLQIDYVSFHLSLLWVDSVLYINCQCTWSVAKLHTFHNIHVIVYGHGYGCRVWIYMECGDTYIHSIISIWTWIQALLCHMEHTVHSTFRNQCTMETSNK